MRVYGIRCDGTLLVSLGGGLGVLTRGLHATPAVDLQMLHAMGPWADPGPVDYRAVEKALHRAQTVPVVTFDLGDRRKNGRERQGGQAQRQGREAARDRKKTR